MCNVTKEYYDMFMEIKTIDITLQKTIIQINTNFMPKGSDILAAATAWKMSLNYSIEYYISRKIADVIITHNITHLR